MAAPRTTPLKRLLDKVGIRQAHLARDLGISPGTLADLVNHGKWPKKNTAELRAAITDRLRHAGADTAQIDRALQPAQPKDAAERPTTAPTSSATSSTAEKETDMLLQKQTLTPAARAHFQFTADPFKNDVTQASDVFINQDIRFVRETLWQTAKHGGMLAIVGESGSGKSTLVDDFKERLLREGRDLIVIEPSVLYMEENDAKGKTLKSAAIVQAIIDTVAPGVSPARDLEARARQVKKLLTAGHRAGQRHLLLIEEAHCLPKATLKHLKRFSEIKDGLSPMLSVVMIAQPELRKRLSVNDPDIREVAQRCDIVELPPLDGYLADYLKFKLARVGLDVSKVITPDGIAALRERLTFAKKAANAKSGQLGTAYISLAYPLAVANALTAAMNVAASLGAPVVDADIVKEA
ncbi:AAA family ATPase [Pseudomonas aeruginosa]